MCVLHCPKQSWPISPPVLRHCPNFCARRWPFVRTFDLTDCPTSSLQHEIFLGNVQKTLFVLATTILLEKSNIKFKAFLIFILSQNPNYQIDQNTGWQISQVFAFVSFMCYKYCLDEQITQKGSKMKKLGHTQHIES